MSGHEAKTFVDRVNRLLAGIPPGDPVVMINLLRYREQADYGSRADIEPCSGSEAYRRYMKQAFTFVTAVGGTVVWQGAPRAVLLGPPGERWDLALLVKYPSKAAFLAMVSDPAYQAVAAHRTAALEDSRLIATLPAIP
jgi:uncharacterized protein (DUF1330 family)